MTETVSLALPRANHFEVPSLKLSTRFWFLVAVTGQLLFVYYIVAFYGVTALQGDLQAWNKVLFFGYISGDSIGNIALAAHLGLAIMVTIGGPIQLISQIRSRAPKFHHWNGRLYVLTSITISIGALYLVLARGTVGGAIMSVGMSINAVLIIICAAMAWRYAYARDFDTHRRWALRLFVMVSGVWFFRIGFMLWMFINQGPVGHTDKFDGPFDIFIVFACYLLPLAVLEIYFRIKNQASVLAQRIMAGSLLVMTLGMAAGIAMTTMFMWMPKL